MSTNPQVKIVGTNGQVSLGKEFAGRMVLVEHISADTWIIKSGEFIPDSEKWLYQGQNLEKIEKALDWAKKHKPQDNFNKIAKDIEND